MQLIDFLNICNFKRCIISIDYLGINRIQITYKGINEFKEYLLCEIESIIIQPPCFVYIELKNLKMYFGVDENFYTSKIQYVYYKDIEKYMTFNCKFLSTEKIIRNEIPASKIYINKNENYECIIE